MEKILTLVHSIKSPGYGNHNKTESEHLYILKYRRQYYCYHLNYNHAITKING
jgi:hypothetical protein